MSSYSSDLNYRICEMRGETLQGVGVLQREESVARNKTSRVIPDDPYMEYSIFKIEFCRV